MGLVLVDLADVEPAILSRFMGGAEARGFLDGVRRAAAPVLVERAVIA